MKLAQILENKIEPPLNGFATDDIDMAIKQVDQLIARLKRLPAPDLTKPVQEQLQTLGMAYQAELWERKKARVR